MFANAKYTHYLARVLIFGLVFVILLGMVPMFAQAAVYQDEIELQTRSILLVDRSGSAEGAEKALEKALEMASYDAIVYFSSKDLTMDSELKYKGDSPICEAIDAAAEGGFTHITVVTDGEQWPQDYSSLGIYSDLDIKIVLTEEELDEEANALMEELQDHLVNSSLEVNFPSGETQQILDGYQPPCYTVEFDIPDPDPVPGDAEDGADRETTPDPDPVPGDAEDGADRETTPDQCNHECINAKCWWWLALLLAILIAALFDFIHELIARRGWFGPTVGKVKKGAKMLLDVSGSMSKYASAVVRAAKKGKAESIVAFGETVQEVELDEVANLDIGGATLGVEALKLAAANGWEEIILVSDLQFNGEALNVNDFPVKFKSITVLAPNPYNMAMISELQQIADRVEVLSL